MSEGKFSRTVGDLRRHLRGYDNDDVLVFDGPEFEGRDVRFYRVKGRGQMSDGRRIAHVELSFVDD